MILQSKSIKLLEEAEMLTIAQFLPQQPTPNQSMYYKIRLKKNLKMNILLPQTGKKNVSSQKFQLSQGENIPIIRQHINQQIFTKCAGHLIKTIHSKPNIILTPSQKIQAINTGTECFFHSATMGQRHCLSHTCLLCDTTALFHTHFSTFTEFLPTVWHPALG